MTWIFNKGYMTSHSWIALGTLGVAFGVAIYTMIRHTDDKRRRIYERLDEVKKDHEEKYVSKEVCGIVHKQTLQNIELLRDDIDEVKMDVKKILTKNGIH